MDAMTPLERELLASVTALQSSHEQQMNALRNGYETQLAALRAGFESVTTSIATRLDELEKTQGQCVAALNDLHRRQSATDRSVTALSATSAEQLQGLGGTLKSLSARLAALNDRFPGR